MANITLLYANPTSNTDVTNTPKTASADNSFDSCDFNNILSSASEAIKANDATNKPAIKDKFNNQMVKETGNETSAREQSSSSSFSSSKQEEKITDQTKNDQSKTETTTEPKETVQENTESKTTENTEKAETTEKAEDTQNITQKNNTAANAEKTAEEKTTPAAQNTEITTVIAETVNSIVQNVTAQTPKSEKNISTPNTDDKKVVTAEKIDSTTQNNKTAQSQTTMAELNTNVLATLTPVAVESTVANIALPIVNQQSNTNIKAGADTSKKSTTVSATEANTSINTQNLEIDATNLYQAPTNVSANLADSNDKIKVQPQSQQVLLNLEPAKNQPTKETTQTAQTISQNNATQTQTPVIQVASDVATKTLTNEQKQTLSSDLEKMTAIQEKMSELKGKVTSAGTTTDSNNSGSSGNLLSQQNAQEQSIKLSVENSPLLNSAQTANQNNFDSTLSGVTTTQQTKTLNSSDILSQIHNKFSEVKPEENTKVTIILNPENLGKVSLELMSGKDGLTAQMTAENAQVKELLDKSLDNLKNSLSSQGVAVNNINVKVAETQEQYNGNSDFRQQQGQQQGQQHSNQQGLGQHQSSNERYSFDEELKGNSLQGEEANNDSIDLGIVDYKV